MWIRCVCFYILYFFFFFVAFVGLLVLHSQIAEKYSILTTFNAIDEMGNRFAVEIVDVKKEIQLLKKNAQLTFK